MEGLLQRTMKLTNRLHNIQMDAPKIVKYENKRLSTLGPHIWNSFSKHLKQKTISQNAKNM